jgi:hypothetical protein
MEATLVTAMIVRKLRLTTVPGYQVVPETHAVPRVRGGLPMTVHRSDQDIHCGLAGDTRHSRRCTGNNETQQ